MSDEQKIDAMLTKFAVTKRPGDYPPTSLIINTKQRVDADRLWARFMTIRTS